MPDESTQTPPALTQDPEEPVIKPLVLAKKEDSDTFDATKVLAAIGLILTITIIIVGIMWITILNLENRVNNLESDVKVNTPTNNTTATAAAAKIATMTATPSAR